MSSKGQEFKGIIPPSESKPQYPNMGLLSFLRDNFTIPVWLCLGAFAQTILFVLADRFNAGRLALLPPILFLAYRTADVYLLSVGWKRNVYMDGVITKKLNTSIPDESGHYGSRPADSEIVVFLIGTRCNHPLGLFAPGFKDMMQNFTGMAKDFETHRDEFGFMGMTSWLNSTVRETNSEIMQGCYFKTVEGLHQFAHSKYHRPAWDWWNRTIKQHPHLSIYYEKYHVPKGHWETVYANSHISGLNKQSIKSDLPLLFTLQLLHTSMDEMTGKKMWETPVVDASRGLLKTSAGRMSRSNATEHDGLLDPYQNQ